MRTNRDSTVSTYLLRIGNINQLSYLHLVTCWNSGMKYFLCYVMLNWDIIYYDSINSQKLLAIWYSLKALKDTFKMLYYFIFCYIYLLIFFELNWLLKITCHKEYSSKASEINWNTSKGNQAPIQRLERPNQKIPRSKNFLTSVNDVFFIILHLKPIPLLY